MFKHRNNNKKEYFKNIILTKRFVLKNIPETYSLPSSTLLIRFHHFIVSIDPNVYQRQYRMKSKNILYTYIKSIILSI